MKSGKLFLKYVSLSVLGMLGLSCYILADTFFVAGAMGAGGLASLNFAIPAYSLVNGAGLLLGVGGATRFAVLKAQKRDEEADRVFTLTLILGVAAGILFLFVGLFLSGPLASLLGADAETFAGTEIYLRTLLSFGPLFVTNNVLIAFSRNDGAPRRAMAAMLVGSLANVLMDYVLMFPCGLGMFGAAFATGLSPLVGIVIVLVCAAFRRPGFRFRRPGCVFGKLRQICAPGLSSLVTELCQGVVILAFNYAVFRAAGNLGVAAYGIVANLALVGISFFTGIAQGVQPLVSDCHGRGETGEAGALLRRAILLALLTGAALFALTFALAGPIVSLFNSEGNAALAVMAKEGLRLYFIGFFFAGTNVVTSAYFSAVERPLPGFLLSVLRGAVFVIPLVFAGGALFGLVAIWLASPVSEALTCAIACVLLWKIFAKGKKRGNLANPH